METKPSSQPPDARSGSEAQPRRAVRTPPRARAVHNGLLRFLIFAATYVVAVTVSVVAHPQTVDTVDFGFFAFMLLAIPLFPTVLAFQLFELLQGAQPQYV